MKDRHFKRIRFVSNARVSSGDLCFDAISRNISLGGLFLQTGQRLPVGSVASIQFSMPSTARPFVLVDGQVVRAAKDGLAFQFKKIDYDTFMDLKTVVQRIQTR